MSRTLSYCSSVVFEHGGAGLHTGVVHHDVDAAEFRHRGIDQRLQIPHVADVGLHADRHVSQRGDIALQRLGRLGMCHIVDDDAGAGLGQPERDGLADPAVSAGDDRDLSLQRHGSAFHF